MTFSPSTLLRALPVMFATAALVTAAASKEFTEERQHMVAEIEAMIAETAGETGVVRLDARVQAAMASVPRHEFAPREYRSFAYRNGPLPIGNDQTISQPYVVALMTELLQLKPTDKVLEVGTGSGYQAAILSALASEVYTIEIVPALGEAARATLQRLGYANVSTRIGDGYQGWPERSPFDAIIVTAAPDHVPPALVAQLKPGGRLVIPVGSLWQELMVRTKNLDGSTTTRTAGAVRFVPLVRE